MQINRAHRQYQPPIVSRPYRRRTGSGSALRWVAGLAVDGFACILLVVVGIGLWLALDWIESLFR